MKNKKINSSRLSSEKKKIALFHLGFFYSGGGEKLILQEIEGLQSLGYEVTCFAPVIDYKNSFPSEIKKYKLKTFLPQLPGFIPHRYLIQLLLTCFAVPLLAPRFADFDIFIGANQPGPWFAFVLSRILKKPYIVYLAQPTRMLHPRKVDKETGFWITRKSVIFPLILRTFRRFINCADQQSIRRANSFLENGDYMQKVLKNVYRRKPIVCPAGTFTFKKQIPNRFSGTLEINNKKIVKPFLLITNRHFPQKKFEFAILALPALLQKNPELTLVVTGGFTDYTKYLYKLIETLNLKERVIFTNLVNEKNLQKLYTQAFCYLYTAPEEDFGMGIIEAMAHSLPVVAWDNAGPKHILTGQLSSLLAPKGKVDKFASLIIRLIDDKKFYKRIAQESYQLAKEKYSMKQHNQIFSKEIERVLSK